MKYFLSTLLSLFVLVSTCFVIMHVLPGDPFQDTQGVPEEVLTQLKKNYGLDLPIYEQYWTYLKRLSHADLGVSFRYPAQTVFGILKTGIPVSMFLGFQAITLALPIGLLLGLIWGSSHAHFRKAWRAEEASFSYMTSLFISMPSFVIAALLQLIFTVWLPIFPIARWGTFSHTVLPTIALAIGPAAMITRLVKTKVVDVLHEEWIAMAQMKGLSRKRILVRHTTPHAIIPALAYIGPVVANLLVGSFAVERVFGIPGLGQWFVHSIITRDYPVISGLTLFYSIVLFGCHLIIDFSIRCIDGRRRMT